MAAANSEGTTSLKTADLPPDARLAAYGKAIFHTLDTDFLTDAHDVSLAGFAVGSLHVIWCDASARRSARTPALIDRDRHDGISFQLILAGRSVGHSADRTIVSDPDTVMILDFAQRFVMVDEGHRVVVNVAVPRALLARQVPDPGALHGRILASPAINLFRGILMSMIDDHRALTPAEGGVVERMLLDAIRIMLDRGGLLGDGQARDGQAGAGQSPLMIRAITIIERRIGSADLTPEWIAEQLGLSRSELYRLFSPVGGVSKVIWSRRLDAAHTALSDAGDHRNIGEIAYAFGFTSEPHFARSFKARFGTTARQLRDQARSRLPA